MLAPGVAFSEPMVTDRVRTERELPLDTQSLITKLEHDVEEAKREKQGEAMLQLVQTVNRDQTNASQLMEYIQESTLEMQTRQKEQETTHQELQRRYEENKKEMLGRDQQYIRKMTHH